MTISAEYRELQKELHQDPNYGVASIEMAPMVIQMAENFNLKSISDYGAGKCNLQKRMSELGRSNFQYFPYDPSFPEYGDPHPAELVCCIDVLEHVEPIYLESVLQDLKKITIKIGMFTVHTGPALKTLTDGRNAHLIQKPSSWWLPQLCKYFEIKELQSSPEGFMIVVEPIIKSD